MARVSRSAVDREAREPASAPASHASASAWTPASRSRTAASYAASAWSFGTDWPSTSRSCQAVTTSLTWWSMATNASSAAPAASRPQAACSSARRAATRVGAGVGQAEGAGGRRHEALVAESVEDRADDLGRRGDGVGDADERGEALDRETPAGPRRRRLDLGGQRRRRPPPRSARRLPDRDPELGRPGEQVRDLRDDLGRARDRAGEDLAGRAVDRQDRRRPRASARRCTTCRRRTATSAAPTTAGIPQPRATTAAWLASPPCEVRMPAATAIPWTSSGDVSARTRIAGVPASAAAAAASGGS